MRVGRGAIDPRKKFSYNAWEFDGSQGQADSIVYRIKPGKPVRLIKFTLVKFTNDLPCAFAANLVPISTSRKAFYGKDESNKALMHALGVIIPLFKEPERKFRLGEPGREEKRRI